MVEGSKVEIKYSMRRGSEISKKNLRTWLQGLLFLFGTIFEDRRFTDCPESSSHVTFTIHIAVVWLRTLLKEVISRVWSSSAWILETHLLTTERWDLSLLTGSFQNTLRAGWVRYSVVSPWLWAGQTQGPKLQKTPTWARNR